MTSGPAARSLWIHATPEEAAALRTVFDKAGYNEAGVLRRYGIAGIGEVIAAIRRPEVPQYDSPLDVLCGLLLEGVPVPSARAGHALGGDALSLFERCGLLEEANEALLAAVTLAPLGDLLLASDRWNAPDRKPVIDSVPDAVYPAHTREVRELLPLLPERGGDMLDLGAGTGILGILYARKGARAVSTDISERCCAAARFNFALNGVTPAAILAGDAYQPVVGRQFDVIVSHPPYVPNLEPGFICSDGGDDGESLLRTIVKGLPRFLRPGGICHVEALGSDRAGAPFEERIRGWLGGAAPEFDIGVFARRHLSADEWIERRGEHWREPIRAWSLERFVLGSFVIRRHAAQAAAITLRHSASEKTRAREIEWAFDVQERVDNLDLANQALRLSPHLAIELRLRREEGAWAEVSQRFSVEQPLSVSGESPGWLAWILQSGDGLTGLECWTRVRELDLIPPQLPFEQFAGPLRRLIASGVLTVDSAPPLPSRDREEADFDAS